MGNTRNSWRLGDQKLVLIIFSTSLWIWRRASPATDMTATFLGRIREVSRCLRRQKLRPSVHGSRGFWAYDRIDEQMGAGDVELRLSVLAASDVPSA
jgi:hypothetical protein